MPIVKHRKIFFVFSAILITASVFAWIFLEPTFGIDFTGGSILEVSYSDNRPELSLLHESLDELNLGNYSLRPSGESGYVLRTREVDANEKTQILNAFSLGSEREVNEERFNLIGPVVGESLKRKSIWAIATVLLGIVLFVTFAFRKVSLSIGRQGDKGLSSWKYGLATIAALVHDVVIPTGAYVVFGKYFSAEIDLLFVTAILAVLGYSVHDTIVVFDRIREHLRINQERNLREPFEKTVGDSLMQTMGRSVNTSLTLLLVLIILYFVGGSATQSFTFLLLAGVIVGTYSSIFFGAPLLVTLEKFQARNK